MPQQRDDENQWLNDGATYAHQRWLLPNEITLGEIYDLGQAVAASDANALESLAVECERRHSGLRGH